MFTEVLEECIRQGIQAETDEAKLTFGETYSSNHEAYAVLKEEVEEAEEKIDEMNHNLNWFWSCIRHGESKPDFIGTIERMQKAAENLAMEACQIAAVCNKILYKI